MHFTQQDSETSVMSLALESPFAEVTGTERLGGTAELFASATISPFLEAPAGAAQMSAYARELNEAIAELRDEGFDEAVAFLAEETETLLSERFDDEAPGHYREKANFAENHLSGVRYEAERYLSALETEFESLDVEAFGEDEIDRRLEALHPQTGDLSPAGEEFIGKLVKKARKAVKFVANAAKKVGKAVVKVAGGVLGPVLNRLKALIRPLLKRVLNMAIGRLPAPLQAPARKLAGKLGFEAEGSYPFASEDEDEERMSPANLTDSLELSEDFDAALGEAMVGESLSLSVEGESEFEWEDTEAGSGTQLEQLAEARAVLIDTLALGDEARVAPAVEQFVPVLLGALKLGINLVGRPKVVSFLAGFLAKLIGKWVGPELSGTLSNAIVDTGLRLISLEAEEENHEAGPLALASVVEDTIRRLAEQEDYIFEDEDLTQLAVSEAFSRAAATHFPARYVRPDLRQAPGLGGVFVRRRPRSIRSYNKFSRVPEIEVTAQIADSIPTFGGTSLGSVLRAAGIAFPFRARMHIYQSAPGTTIAAIIRSDRSAQVMSGASFHPLSPTAAGVLLREPRLGTASPARFRRSGRRLGVGQRVFALQPVGVSMPSIGDGSAARAAKLRIAPSRSSISVDHAKSEIGIALSFSERRSQEIARSIREGRGHGVLLQALTDAYGRAHGSGPQPQLSREVLTETEELTATDGRLGSLEVARLLRRLRPTVIPALASWCRQYADVFARAAANPAPGVTVLIRIRPVDLSTARSPAFKRHYGASAPRVGVTVEPGMQRR
jgi:hypothetical protein